MKTPKIVLLLFAVLITGCITRNTTPPTSSTAGTVEESRGKIIIQYQYSQSDIQKPPTGFNVWRSASPDGPFQKVNEKAIAAKGNPVLGDIQELMTDYGLPLGRTYYYFLEKIGADGKVTKATTVAPATVNLPLQPQDHKMARRAADETARKTRLGQKTTG